MSDSIDIPKGYKQTKVGVIPEDWGIEKFSSFSDFKNGLNYSKEEKGEGLKIIGVGDFQQHTYISYQDLEQVNLISKVSTDYLLKNNDLLFVRSNGNKDLVGRVLLITDIHEDVSHSGFTIRARINKSTADPIYYAYVFKSAIVKNQFKRLGAGTNISNLSQQILGHLKLPYPQLPEQQKIAAILTTWDKSISTTQSIVDELKLRNKGLAQQLLTGKKRLKEFNGEWKKKHLSYFIDYSPRPTEKPDDNYLALGLRSHGKGIFHKPDFDPDTIAMETLYVVKENDLVVNITFAWEHAIAVANKIDEGGLVSHRFPTYTFIEENSDSNYFKFFVLQPYFKYLLELISPGGAGRNRVMSKKDFIKLEIKAPEKKEQIEIAKILVEADQELKLFEQKLVILKEQKKGLMQKLLTGEIRVNTNRK